MMSNTLVKYPNHCFQFVTGHLIAGLIGSGVSHLAFDLRTDGGFNAECQFSQPREKKTGDNAGNSSLGSSTRLHRERTG